MRGDLCGSWEGAVIGVRVEANGGGAVSGELRLMVLVSGGSFHRVWCWWMCGAVRITICGAVGLDDVGIGAGAPFEVGHGSMAG